MSEENFNQTQEEPAASGALKPALWFERIAELILLASLFFLPLWFIPLAPEVFEIHKQILLFVSAILIFFFWLLNSLFSQNIFFPKTILSVFLVSWLAIQGISSAFSLDRIRSFLGFGLGSHESLATSATLLLLFFLALILLAKKASLVSKTFGAFLASLTLAMGLSFLSLGGVFEKLIPQISFSAISTIGLGSQSSVFFASASASALAAALFFRNKIVIVFSSLVFLAGFLLLSILGFSKIWLALAAISALLLILAVLQSQPALSPRVLVPAALLALFLVFGFQGKTISSFLNQLMPAPIEISPSFSVSLDIAKKTLSEQPAFGSGPGTWIFDFAKYKPERVNQDPLFWNVRFAQGNSKISTILATSGVIGTVMWILVLIVLILSGARRIFLIVKEKTTPHPIFISSFLGWLVLALGQFLYTTNTALEAGFFFLSAIFLASPKSSQENKSWQNILGQVKMSPTSPRAYLVTFSLIGVLVGGILLGFFVVNRYLGIFAFHSGLESFNQGNFSKARENLLKAVNYESFNDLYSRTASQAALLELQANILDPQAAPEYLQFLVNFSETAARRATELSPSNPENWIQLASVYENLIPFDSQAQDLAIQTWRRAGDLEPASPFYPFSLGRVYLTIYDVGRDKENLNKFLDLAQDQFSKALEKKPDYAPAHFQLAMIEVRKGRAEEAINRLEQTKEFATFDPFLRLQLAVLRYNKQEYSLAREEIMEALALSQPFEQSQPSLRQTAQYLLGLTESKLGNRQEALNIFKKLKDELPQDPRIPAIIANLEQEKDPLEGLPPIFESYGPAGVAPPEKSQ